MRSVRRGFTLLEVLVAVAILGLAMTAILAAQAGAVSSAAHARNISIGTGLLRCKMTEVEEKLMRDGFPELDEDESGQCCAGDESAFRCAWKVEKPEFPEPKYGELDLDTDIGSADMGPLGLLSQGAQGANPLGQNASPGDIAQQLSGGGAEGAGDALSGALGMVLGMVYPDIKALFEASTRRITVKITWMEGGQERAIEIGQWFTIPQRGQTLDVGGIMNAVAPAAGGAPPSGPRAP
ncbi:MAG TPA: prepilin-type N-terminal cleavage/methylation domain-containing protein [Candidatus Nanopelagicales bacterium]|nr:prepilin-type N-terminal cleavage/methylation domain-containing protein [Candidatus Nanopelagicales bacterium]